MANDEGELIVLAALAAARGGLSHGALVDAFPPGEGRARDAQRAVLTLVARGEVTSDGDGVELSALGARRLQTLHAEIAAALDTSPRTDAQETCPSVPLLTTVATEWVDALSFNYAVDAAVLAGLLPEPLRPELHRGSAWVQVLVSSLRDMRPQGMLSLFGVSFYQISYRAAVVYRSADGTEKRGGYFVRSETNHEVMRAVGLALREFKFHAFGAAEMIMLRDGEKLSVGVQPGPSHPGGRLVSIVDTTPLAAPPAGSVWSSVDDLSYALVECYDALGVDPEGGFLYVLTIDRDPWRARFVAPVDVYCEHMTEGPFAGASRLDSVLHVPRCAYRWRPLRRERLAR